MIFIYKNKDNSLHYQEDRLAAIRKRPLLEQLIATTGMFVVDQKITPEIATAVRSETTELVEKMTKSTVTRSLIANLFRLDPTLQNHITSVCILATALGQTIVYKDKLLEIAEGAIYHDIGKLKTPRHILSKTTALTTEERKIIQLHPEDGELELRMMLLLGIPLCDMTPRITLEHHERFDGSGYPFGKKGETNDFESDKTHIYSSIVAIADVASALLMQRTYKGQLSMEQVISIMDLIPLSPYVYKEFKQMMIKSL